MRALLFLAIAALAACASPHFDGTALPARAAPPFTLTDQTGRAWSLASQRGTTIALYFGYTHCPDDCPLTLAMLSRVFAQLDPHESHTEVVFVTVDPARDTPPVIAAFIHHFHGARIVGLTGTPSTLRAIQSAYHIWSQKMPGPNAHGGYAVAHASPVFLIDASGMLRVIHDDNDPRSAFVHDLRALGA